MKTKTRKEVKASGESILKALKALKAAPIPETSRSRPAAPAAPVKNPEGGSFAQLYQARGGRIWFQLAGSAELRVRMEALKAKYGVRTLNDLAARVFDEAMGRAGL